MIRSAGEEGGKTMQNVRAGQVWTRARDWAREEIKRKKTERERERKRNREREGSPGKVVGAVREGSIINDHFMQGCSRLLVLREHPGHRAKQSHYYCTSTGGKCNDVRLRGGGVRGTMCRECRTEQLSVVVVNG
jgi:hypothetical protein